MLALIICKFDDVPIKTDLARLKTVSFPLKFYGKTFQHSKASNSEVKNQIWLKFKLIRDVMPILVTCQLDEDPVKTEGAIVSTTLRFFQPSKAGNAKVNGRMWLEFKLIRDFMPVLV